MNLRLQLKEVQEKSCQTICSIININNKKHVILKNLDNEKMTEKITQYWFQAFYLLQVFSI